MAGGGIWIIKGSDGIGPIYKVYLNDDAETPYDLTDATLRVDFFDAYNTGSRDGGQTPPYPGVTMPAIGWEGIAEVQQPLLSGTNDDGMIVVDDAPEGELHLVLTWQQSLTLFQRSWANQRAPRQLVVTIWRTDNNQRLSLYRVIEQARA